MDRITRRNFLKIAGTAGAAACVLGPAGCIRRVSKAGKKVIVLGFDGMDPVLLKMLSAKGDLPNLTKLLAMNNTLQLGTSTPPQSPVAWADFISGANPGYHGLFDFILRDPATYLPYFSISESYAAERTLTLGNSIIPLGRSGMRLLRKGEAFWNVLENAGVPCTVHRVPSNFPPQDSKAHSYSGMGTPDMLGGYGSFSYYTTNAAENKPDITGGTVTVVSVKNGAVNTAITGPNNQFVTGAPPVKAQFTAYLDAASNAVRIDVQGKTILLKQGEWSQWTRLSFPTLPHLSSTSGIVLFHLREVSPHFRLYVSPVNVDPLDPAVPLSTPSGYSHELANKFGRFYTTGIPEDTKALNHGMLSDGEYLQQSAIHHSEQRRIFYDMLKNHHSGLMFFYFSDTDLGSHMFWSAMDKTHPQYPMRDHNFSGAIFDYYRALDKVAGDTMATLGHGDTIMIISDHGFAPFGRAFHLNTWLKNHGHAALLGEASNEEFLQGVDWSNTHAYALGFNALYVNESGREKYGLVQPGPEKEKLLDDISRGLLAAVDVETGGRPVSSVYRTSQVYSGPNMQRSPDLIIGYNRGYRASWETAVGKFPSVEVEYNKEKWSGDHCIDPKHVPGIVLTNKRITAERPCLRDISATVLAEFGQPTPPWMQGRPIF